MSIPFIAGNWKMYKTVPKRSCSSRSCKSAVKDISDVEIVLAPPFTAVHAVGRSGAQHEHRRRARRTSTGSAKARSPVKSRPTMVKEAGAEYAIVGHSERRRLFGESDAIVNRKAMAALGAGLTPIVCIGETLEERERDETLAVLDRQIKDGLDQMSAEQMAEHRGGIRAGLGDRDGADGDAPRRPARPTRTSASGCGNGSAPTRPSGATSSTAAA